MVRTSAFVISVIAVVAFVCAAPARADCMTGSSYEERADEEMTSLAFAALGGLVGAGAGFAAGYGVWAASGTSLEAQQWFTEPGMIVGLLGGLVGGFYVHTVLEEHSNARRP